MIITDIRKLREIQAGEIVTLVLQFEVVKMERGRTDECPSCIFAESGCSQCGSLFRPDKTEVKFVKI